MRHPLIAYQLLVINSLGAFSDLWGNTPLKRKKTNGREISY